MRPSVPGLPLTNPCPTVAGPYPAPHNPTRHFQPTLRNPSSGAEAHLRVSRGARSAGLVLVEPAFRDVLDDPVPPQVPDGFPGRDTLPAVGRGDSEGGDLHQAALLAGQPM